MVGGLQFARKFAGPHIKRQKAMCCDSVAMPAVSSRCQLKSLRDERWRRPLSRREDRRAGSPNAKRGHDTGPKRGPSLHVQGSVWRSCGSSLTLGTQAPDDRMEGFDPLETFVSTDRMSRIDVKAVIASGQSVLQVRRADHLFLSLF